MVITADAIKVVIAIVRCGSFAAASQELHKVPSALSYTLHKLEDSLGVSLFERQESSWCLLRLATTSSSVVS